MIVDLRFICENESESNLEVYDIGPETTQCFQSFNFHGHKGCRLDLSEFVFYIAKYIGWIMILVGLVMTFNGYNFLEKCLTFIVFVVMLLMSFFFFLNMGLIEDPRYSADEGLPWFFACMCLVCFLFALVCAHWARKIINKEATMMLGAFCSGATIYFILAGIGVTFWIILVCVILFAGVGGYYAHKADIYIKAGLTSLLGSMLLMRSISFYITNPAAQADTVDGSGEFTFADFIVNLGVIIFAALGTYVQLTKYIKKEDKRQELYVMNDAVVATQD